MRAPETVFMVWRWTYNDIHGSSTELLGIFWTFEGAEEACKAHHARWRSDLPWLPLEPHHRMDSEAPVGWSNEIIDGCGLSEGYDIEKRTVV